MSEMISLQDALKRLVSAGVPIEYPTLYQWAKRGILIGDAPTSFAVQIGNRWNVDSDKLKEVIDAIRNHTRVRMQPTAPVQKKNTDETRGRKPGTRFGKYRRRGIVDPHGLLIT